MDGDKFNLVWVVLGVSQIVLLALRGADAMGWPWYIVLIPLWVTVGLLGAVVGIVVMATILDTVFD